MPDRKAIDDWLRVHRELMDKEAAFTELAMRAAQGTLPLTELEKERHSLMAMRSLCTSVYEKAFPKS